MAETFERKPPREIDRARCDKELAFHQVVDDQLAKKLLGTKSFVTVEQHEVELTGTAANVATGERVAVLVRAYRSKIQPGPVLACLKGNSLVVYTGRRGGRAPNSVEEIRGVVFLPEAPNEVYSYAHFDG